MLAYKFRSADRLDWAFDIILKERFRCSDWRLLNDPMEGQFVCTYTLGNGRRSYSELIDEIIRHKKRLLVCALSRTFNCHLLWAHYASGFRGVAIEVDLPDDDQNVRPIQYRGVFAQASFDHADNPEEFAIQILSSKYREWEYEREVRILHTGEWYKLRNPIRCVIAGHRMDAAVFEALQIICNTKNIPIARVRIGDEGIDADPVSSIRPLKKRTKKR